MKTEKGTFRYFHGRTDEKGVQLWIFVCQECNKVFESKESILVQCYKCKATAAVIYPKKEA